jgi:ribosome recycling factor
MLTTERRQQYVKIIKDKMEEARVRLKSAREDVKKKIEQGGKDSEYGKDEEKRLLDNMQSKVDSANGDFEALFNTKEKDILGE